MRFKTFFPQRTGFFLSSTFFYYLPMINQVLGYLTHFLVVLPKSRVLQNHLVLLENDAIVLFLVDKFSRVEKEASFFRSTLLQ